MSARSREARPKLQVMHAFMACRLEAQIAEAYLYMVGLSQRRGGRTACNGEGDALLRPKTAVIGTRTAL